MLGEKIRISPQIILIFHVQRRALELEDNTADVISNGLPDSQLYPSNLCLSKNRGDILVFPS